ncbi:uncharacterized protein [Leptinotarsa decemlineata]|uniref:uncharacterized protein n=1 Tax=Leptinotarsa decemlineata TaxID=7539 RepID=UPI003D303FB9
MKMPRDQTAHAKIRNRAERTQLQTELQRIEREKQNAMRNLDLEKRRFRTKCSKMLIFSKPKSREVGDGSHETFQKKSDSFVDLHDLVFTNGEVDAGKVLCLHVISAHRAETLMPPKKRLSYLCKEHSPTERILEKSRSGYANNEKLSNLLPLYTVEMVHLGAMGENSIPPVINDGRLAARILINENIRQLIGTVIKALETSNKDKLRQLVRIAHDPSAIRTILARKDIQEFMTFLQTQPIINNSESFLLTPPFKIKTRDLNFRSMAGNNLESLINNIRQNVLQIPTRKPMIEGSEDFTTILEPQEMRSSSERIRPITMASGPRGSPGPEGNDTNEKQFSKKQRHRGRTLTNFIAKNIREAPNVKKIEYDEDETEGNIGKRSATILLKSKVSPSPISQSNSVENNPTDENLVEMKVSIKPSSSSKIKKSAVSQDSLKFRVKKILCPACKEKWRTPLPPPKTPRVKKSSVLPPENPLKTDSRLRLNVLINREIYTQERYEKRYLAKNSPVSIGKIKKDVPSSLSDIKLSPLDLARIQQEIRVKETHKKLEKFLCMSV